VSRRAAAAVAVAAALAAGAAHAHVIYGTATLRGLVQESDVVARVRIVDAGALLPMAEPIVVAEPLEWIKGSAAPGPLRFVQHGHGVPLYHQGDQVALFLQRIERSRELASLAGNVAWVSIQEGDPLAGSDTLAAALRAYAALEKLPAAERARGLRRLTVALLASPDPKLASSAVRDVALAGDAPIVTAEDVPALEKILRDGSAPIELRVALLAELERRRLVDGPAHWTRLLRETRGADRLPVVRAAAAHPGPALTRELVALLASDDPLVVSAAAISLGVPGNDAAVEPLAEQLGSNEERVRMAAIRGLERIGTPAAHARLSQAASAHPDAATRRRASAALAR
jgi:hypothetical protein